MRRKWQTCYEDMFLYSTYLSSMDSFLARHPWHSHVPGLGLNWSASDEDTVVAAVVEALGGDLGRLAILLAAASNTSLNSLAWSSVLKRAANISTWTEGTDKIVAVLKN